MKNDPSKKLLITGFLAGAIVALVISSLTNQRTSQKMHVLAEVGGEQLSKQALEKQMAEALVPVDNDEYAILKQGLDQWVSEKLIEKEAKSQGITAEDLYQKELWSKVQVSQADALAFYNSHQDVYNLPFEQLQNLIFQELRRQKYSELKDQYLQMLRKKYDVKVYLQKPKSYVEGLGMPAMLGGQGLQVIAPQAPQPAQVQAPQPEAPAALVTFDDLAGKPSLGPENAPITLVEFSDFHCPFCKRITPTLDELMKNYSGKIRRVWRHYPLPFHTGADQTHAASECAHEQGKFWEYHAKLFETQGGARDNQALTDLAKQVGVNEKKFKECLESGKYKSFIEQEINKGNSVGVDGTPAVFVNGVLVSGAYPYEYFSNMIDKILNPGQAQAAQPNPVQPQAPPPPAVVSFNDLDGRPSQGPQNAPVTIVEFSDFHCPFCSRVEPTIKQLMQLYPDKIRVVWRHYPLPMHAGSDQTHAASECAHEQGKFWEYHDKLFATQGSTRDDQALIAIAKEVGANDKKFKECLTSGKYKSLIQQEMAKGNASGVQGTPTFFVNGQMLAGAQPLTSFQRAVDNALNPGAVQPQAAVPQAPAPPAIVQFNDLAGHPSEGPDNAPITLVEFSDFHCPFCSRVSPTIQQLMNAYPGKIKRVWRHFPLPMHQGADRTSEASECAAEQGKFWQYHDKIFETQGGARDDQALIGLAKQVGANEKKFKECLESGKYKDLVQKDIAKGRESGVRGTPSFFINGQLMSGAKPFTAFDTAVKNELNKG